MKWRSGLNDGVGLSRNAGSRSHVVYLDGLRALAAILVVISHCDVWTCHVRVYQTWWLDTLGFAGNLCVATFIVLSGYLLALPLVKTGALPGGTEAYLRRRGRRIIPAYLFALAFSVVIALKVTHEMEVNELATPGIVAAVFLLHDLVPPPLDFNAPLWSIPVEWHIYFTLPLVAWAWRRWGALRSVLGAACLSFLLIGVSHRIGRPCLYLEYYAMFYAGCGAAWISYSTAARAALYRALPWPVVSGGLILLFCCFWAGGGAPEFGLHVEDFRVAWALLLATGLVALAGPQPSRVRDFLSARPLVSAAGFSYSLYLLHWPVLAVISDLWLPAKLPSALYFWLMVVIGLPLSLALAYISSLVFEHPFQHRPNRSAGSRRASPVSVVIQPASPRE